MPKGPVDFVFDVQDTEGREIPENAFSFPTFGNLTEYRFNSFMSEVAKQKIMLSPFDGGDGFAGFIKLKSKSISKRGKNTYELGYNKNHRAPVRFVSVAHELAHLFLGHIGPDNGRRVPDRSKICLNLKEVEAEITAYLVAIRNGINPRSEKYLANYKGEIHHLHLYTIFRAANAVETAMGISAQKLWKQKEILLENR